MNLASIDIYELKARWDSLTEKYVLLATELAPLLDKFGKYREELQLLVVEIQKRGYEADSPENLIETVEKAISKREEQSE